MPASGEVAKGSNASGRTTFRPPWVKEGAESKDPLNPFNLKSVPRKQEKKEESPSSDSSSGDSGSQSNPIAKLRKVAKKESSPKEDDVDDITIPEKDNPLEGVQLRKVKKKEPYERESFRKEKENNPLANVKLRKTSVQTKEPQQNGEEKDSFFVKPQLKPVPQREKTPPKKDHKIHDLPSLKKVEERKLPERKPSLLRKDSTIEEMEIDRVNGKLSKELPAKRNSLVRAESMRRLSQTPAPPPMPPPPPGMPGELPKKPLTGKQQKKIDQLKARPKVRPDWSATLKEIEGGKKLRHVECNDRSQPLLPEAKAQEHFLYASEKPNVHNELLKQIESGIKLKRVQTNDRSKPILEGLRKFRRQMTIEEQVQKSISMASMPPVSDEIAPEEVDELDDIDKVRDDLQSTKQMLALELRNKEAQEMENKRLLARLANLEAELEKAKSGGGGGGKANSAADEKVIQSLKKESEQSRKNSEQIEKKYTEAVKQLDTTKLQLEETRRKNLELEKKLIDALGGKRVSLSNSRQNSVANGEEDDDIEDEETEEESDGEDNPEKKEKRLQKEVKQLGNKLRNFKNKEDNAKKERIALKEIIKKNQAAIKEEKKKYDKIKKEVDKMASLLKDVADEEEEDEEKDTDTEEEEVEEEESSEEETESESGSDDSDSEKSLSEPEDAPVEKKKVNLASRSKRHEARLGALKKGNFLLKTNAERLQDDLNKQKEMTAELQEDLDSVLSELG